MELVPQLAIPPPRFGEKQRRRTSCKCGAPIVTSAFGWVHSENAWVKLGQCGNATPRHDGSGGLPG